MALVPRLFAEPGFGEGTEKGFLRDRFPCGVVTPFPCRIDTGLQLGSTDISERSGI
jgi:hypothetical protein